MYKTGKDASDYWKEIVRAAQINVIAVYSSIGVYEIERVNPVLAKYIDLALKDVINHVIFEVYYIIYLLCTEHNSLTYYYKMFFSESNTDTFATTNIVDEYEYSKPLYDYEKFRTKADKIAQSYYNAKNIGLYKKPDSHSFTGHQLTLLDYLFLYRSLTNDNIGLLFKSLRDHRLPSAKSISDDTFKNHIITGIHDLYDSILTFDYGKYSKPDRNYFLKCVDFYQLEKNCAIEFNYKIAYAVSNINKKLNDKKKDITAFKNMRLIGIAEEKMLIQNKYICPTNNIFTEYINGYLSVNDIQCYYSTVNYMIHIGLYYTLKSYFASYFTIQNEKCFYARLYLSESKVRELIGLNTLNDFMCRETEIFFKLFLGMGQHIQNKKWECIKLRHFRDMYTELTGYI